MNDPLIQIILAAAIAFPLTRLVFSLYRQTRVAAHTGDTLRRQGPCVPFQEAQSADMIEPGIAPLVQALNQVDGVETIASCEAHVIRPAPDALLDGLPYVMFRAPQGFVQSLDTWVSLGATRHPGATFYHWELTAHFRPPGPPGEAVNDARAPASELVWTIRTADVRIPSEFSRSHVDADVRLIAASVRRIASLIGVRQREGVPQ